MDLAFNLEKGVGIFYLILGISFWVNAKKLWFPLVEKFKDPAFLIFSGLFALTIGTFMILFHNVWSNQPEEILTTVTGWGLFLEGIRYLLFPGTVLKFIPKSLNLIHWVGGAISIITGTVILLTIGGVHWT